MTQWILVLIVSLNPLWDGRGGSGVAIEQVTFNSEAACHTALRQAKALATERNRTTAVYVDGFCVQK